jgi:hypothetical protein
MADNIQCVVNVGSLPPAAKFPDWQTLVNEIGKILNVYLPGAYSPINYGSTTPTAENQDRPWVRTNVDGSPDRVYVYYNGKWVSPHPITGASSYRALWVGSLASLYSFDGGDGTDPTVIAPTATTGAMWQEDTDFQDKIPMGVLAATGQVPTVGATAGALDATIAEANLPEHFHFVANTEQNTSNETALQSTHSLDRAADDWLGGNRQYALSGTDAATKPATVGKTSVVGSGTALSILPPVRGIYVIKRSARTHFAV